MYPFFPVPSSAIEKQVGAIPGAMKVRSNRTGVGYYISYEGKCPGINMGPAQDWNALVRIWEQHEGEISAHVD